MGGHLCKEFLERSNEDTLITVSTYMIRKKVRVMSRKIPKNITREDVVHALQEIQEKGVPSRYGYRTNYVLFENEKFPPKYVIMVANKYANGRELDASELYTNGARKYLRDLGFKVIREEKEGINDDETAEERYQASVSLERDLHEFLFRNLDFLEEGLQPYEGRTGSEYSTDAGRIDILAVDRNGDLVVIEIKTGTVKDKVMGQIMRYVGFVKEHIAEKTQDVRAIIVADDFDENLKYSKLMFPNLELKRYEVSFEFTEKKFL